VVAASKHPLLRDYSTSQQHLFDAGGRKALRYVNSNRLVRGGRWDIDLQKTGYIIEAGHCVVMLARVANRDLVMVLLDASDNAVRSADAERIRRWLDPETARNEARAARETRTAAKAAPRAANKRVSRQFAQR
jgi:serine-type D-Ala-D-Ala endopeptidase (penicillin-binding protein 7)